MTFNADLLGRHLLRMASEIEALVIQRDALAEENERMKQEIASLKSEAPPEKQEERQWPPPTIPSSKD